MNTRCIGSVMAGLLLACASSQAQQFAMAGQDAAAPKWETQNGVSYACGGIGADEAAALKEESAGHDLMVTFAAKSGEYLGDAHVTIADSRGRQLVDTTCGGPIMLADLPKAGKYSVRAEVGGLTARGTVAVRKGKGVKSLPLVWPRENVEAG